MEVNDETDRGVKMSKLFTLPGIIPAKLNHFTSTVPSARTHKPLSVSSFISHHLSLIIYPLPEYSRSGYQEGKY